jgi:predicted dehydrogenase
MDKPDRQSLPLKPKLNRRQFLGYATAGSLALSGWNKTRAETANIEKIKIGLIGCGWYGMVDLNAAFKGGGVECLALCDVDSDHLEKAANEVNELQGSRPQLFSDYRDLLRTSGLQAVIIATPPQWHALPFIEALERGLDVYCEKPLAYDIREGQAMTAAAERSDRMVQVGFQRRQSKAIQQAREYIRQGNLGKIIQVDVQIHYTAKMLDPTPQTPPQTLDWDFWCGPAPKLPYSPQIGHKAWRLEKAYGNGHLVDWGIHLIDAIRWTLDETTPLSVQSAGGIYVYDGYITTPDILTTTFDFATCPVVWRHRLWGATEYTPEVSNGIFFYGEKGTVFVTDRRWVIIPNAKDKERQEFKIEAEMGRDHMADFLQSVKTREKPLCTPRDAFFSTATVQLGMIAYETAEKIRWDHDTLQILGSDQAAALLKRSYRAPWKHPFTA